jgi:hypothetical protein
VLKIAQPVHRMVGRGMAQKNVVCLMELYEDVLQNSLLSCILLFSYLVSYIFFRKIILMHAMMENDGMAT